MLVEKPGERLWMAANRGQGKVVPGLLKKCQSDKEVLNFKGGNRQSTPLNEASFRGHTAVVELLLLHGGADIEATDSFGRTALIAASMNGLAPNLITDGFAEVPHAESPHAEAMKVLLRHGAEIDVKDHEGYTALIWAFKKNHTAAMEVLLRHGTDIEAKDKKGKNALIWASQERHIAAMSLLLSHEADKEAGDNTGKTPLIGQP